MEEILEQIEVKSGVVVTLFRTAGNRDILQVTITARNGVIINASLARAHHGRGQDISPTRIGDEFVFTLIAGDTYTLFHKHERVWSYGQEIAPLK